MEDPKVETAPAVRIDKWLWAARFFKTRSLASQAIAAGHVKSTGTRVKPAHIVKVGEELSVAIGPYTHILIVRSTSAVRRGAPEARLLYEESMASIVAREALSEMRKIERSSFEPATARPSKRDRRAVDRLRGR